MTVGRKRKQIAATQAMPEKATGGAGVSGFRLLLAGLGCAGALCAIWLATAPRGGGAAEVEQDARSALEETSTPAINAEQAVALARRALAVRDVAGVAALIRPGAASAEQVISFLEGIAENDGTLENLEWMTSTTASELPLERVFASYAKDGQRSNRLALLTPGEDGRWRMDFEAFARWCEPGWSEVLTGHGGPALVRVFVSPDSYYNGAFQDEDGWRCVSMASPDVEELQFAYVKADTPQDAAMRRLLKDSRRSTRAVLRIRHPEGAEPRQFEVLNVVARDWVLGPVSYDGE